MQNNEEYVPRVVVLTAKCFQDEEYIYAYHRLKEEGYHVEVATPGGEVVYGKFGVPAKPTQIAEDLSPHDYDALVIPGGFEAPGRLRCISKVVYFVHNMNEMDKPIGAICHGPSLLISARAVVGKDVTGYLDIADDLKNAGANYIPKGECVISKNLITSWHYDCNGQFMRGVVSKINRYWGTLSIQYRSRLRV